MGTKFVADREIWPLLGRLAKRPGQALAAVPYFTEAGADMLPLKKGDVLVTRFTLDAVRGGLVHPQSVLDLLERNVQVFSDPNLHSKVYVFPSCAVVGSSNATLNARDVLKEACVYFDDKPTVRSARRYVNGLEKSEVTKALATKWLPEYRPSKAFPFKGARSTRKSKTSLLVRSSEPVFWLAKTIPWPCKTPEEIAAVAGVKSAASRSASISVDEVETFYWSLPDGNAIKPGDTVMHYGKWGRGGAMAALRPGVVHAVRKATWRGKQRVVIAYSSRDATPARLSMAAVQRQLGKAVSDETFLKRGLLREASGPLRKSLLRMWNP